MCKSIVRIASLSSCVKCKNFMAVLYCVSSLIRILHGCMQCIGFVMKCNECNEM